MRALLFSSGVVAVLAVACSGNDVSIGANDSGNPEQQDGAMSSMDGSNGGQDTGVPGDSGRQDDTGVGKDSGTGQDSGITPDGGCMPKTFNFQCGQGSCQGGETQYCSPYPQTCTSIPQACQCNYTCQCLLANIKNPCLQMIMPKCMVGGTGALYLSCN
jgi:hypothetical protein